MATILTQVKLATSVNIDLTDVLTVGISTIDGKTVYANDRILVKAQTDKTQNGIYVVGSDGILTRATDFANGASITPTTAVFVQQGDQFADSGWIVSTDSQTNLTIGSDQIEFSRFSINQSLVGVDLPSSIVLRSEKGYPLTITELDNNFKYLAISLTQKLNIADFTQSAISDRLNSVSYEVSNIDANKLHGFIPTTEVLENSPSIALRNESGNLNAVTFTGDLIGNADTASFANVADTAHYLDRVNPIAYGGTGASTSAGARANLDVVAKEGDTMRGKLTLAAASASQASLNIPSIVSAIASPEDGDIWGNTTSLFYYRSGVTRTFAPLESPSFSGAPLAPTPDKISNSGSIATTAFVQSHVTDLNAAIALKSNIESPTFTGNPKAPTPDTADNDTSIATTAYVVNKINSITPSYYTRSQVDAAVEAEAALRLNKDTDLQSQIDDLNKTKGIPVGTVMFYASAAVPIGWLKCDGSLVSRNAFPQLFGKIGYTYGGSGNDFRLPDLRGEFLRGWDDGRGIDAGRAFGSLQKGSLIGFDESYDFVWNLSTTTDGALASSAALGMDVFDVASYPTARMTGASYSSRIDLSRNSNSAGYVGISRPRNVSMLPCIKAYGDVDDPSVITSAAVLDSITYKVDKRGDSMSGYLTLSADPVNALHATTKQYVDSRINTISLTPGPQGPAGPAGPQGPQGPVGSSYAITYGNTQYSISGFTNSVGNWYNHANYFDVYPPAGKTMANLLAFLPSIAVIHYAGGVDGNDSLRCTWSNLGDRIRVYVQNTEQRSTPAANWIAFWS